MAEEIKIASSLAMFDCGEGRGEIQLEVIKDGNGDHCAKGADDLYQYIGHKSDYPCNGTLFVRNKKTGEMKAIPINQFMQISRLNLISSGNEPATANYSSLIQQFGSRSAQRIQKMRNRNQP